MGELANTITLTIKKKLLERFPKSDLTRAAEKAREEIIRLMTVRILDGEDIYGKQFAPYTKQYKRLKQRAISGDFKKNKSLRKIMANKTAYKANKVGDFMRLSGSLMSDIQSKVLSISGGGYLSRTISMKLKIYVGSKNVPKAEGLMRKRKWFGIARSGNRQQLESKRITEIIVNELRSK